MTEDLDPRLHPYRDDLAGAELGGRVEAPRFVEARPARVAAGTADQRRAPARDAMLVNQLFHGDEIAVYETEDGWAWVQNRTDGYMGYLAAEQIGDALQAADRSADHSADHWVKVPRSFVFPEPDEKAPPLDALPMTARVRVLAAGARYSEIAWGAVSAWVPARHLAPAGESLEDFVATALAFVGVPYLWGGRTSLGLDCSGLVQVVLAAAGIACPRDSDLQARSLGTARPLDEPPRRGDLLYMPGHVVIALDSWRVLHPNAHEMLTSIEPLEDLVARVEETYGQGLTAVRRVD